MTTIGGVSGAVPTTTPELIAGAGFDGETLMLYCQSQLNDLNSEIKAKMDGQRESREQKQLLNKLTAALGKYSQTYIGAGDKGARYEILKTYAEVISKLPPGPNKDALMTQFNHFRSTSCYSNGPVPPVPLNNAADAWAYIGTPGKGLDVELNKSAEVVDAENAGSTSEPNAVTADEINAQLKALQPIGDEIGKNSELEMIGLQQVISNRQMAIQMATNMMNKFLQGLDAIAANVGK